MKKYYGRNLLSGFAPDTFLKPVILISTVFGGTKQERSTAICFGKALNRFHLMEKFFTSRKDSEVSEFIIIKKHKTWKEAYQYHIKLMETMDWDSYSSLYDKHCPKELKNINRGVK